MQISRAIMMGLGIFIRRVKEARIGRAGGRRAPIGKCDVMLEDNDNTTITLSQNKLLHIQAQHEMICAQRYHEDNY